MKKKDKLEQWLFLIISKLYNYFKFIQKLFYYQKKRIFPIEKKHWTEFVRAYYQTCKIGTYIKNGNKVYNVLFQIMVNCIKYPR